MAGWKHLQASPPKLPQKVYICVLLLYMCPLTIYVSYYVSSYYICVLLCVLRNYHESLVNAKEEECGEEDPTPLQGRSLMQKSNRSSMQAHGLPYKWYLQVSSSSYDMHVSSSYDCLTQSMIIYMYPPPHMTCMYPPPMTA